MMLIYSKHRVRGMVMGRWFRFSTLGYFIDYRSGRHFTGEPITERQRILEMGKLQNQ